MAFLVRIQFTPLYWGVFLFGLVWMSYLGLNSPEAAFRDEVGHVLMSRNAWNYPELTLHVWGRPFNTIVYMIPSLWGLGGARTFSVFLSALTVLFTTKVAQQLDIKQLAWIPLCLWFQPWVAGFYFTANTMIPFAFLLIMGIYLWQSEQEDWASIPFGLLPLTRHEGIALTGAWFVYMLYQRRWKAAGISVLPMIIWNVVYLAVYQTMASSNLTSINPTDKYGSGGWFYYLPYILVGVYPAVLFMSFLGITPISRDRRKQLVLLPYGLYLGVHVVIYRFGLFASGGYGFFLIPLAPAFALSAAIGIERVIAIGRRQARSQNQRVPRYKILVAAIVFAVLLAGLLTRPVPYNGRVVAMQAASEWLEGQGYEPSQIWGINAWAFYLNDLEWTPERPFGWVNLDEFESGMIFIWDSDASPRRVSFEALSAPNGEWKQLAEFGDGYVVIFQKQ
jgi:hypothetical protein